MFRIALVSAALLAAAGATAHEPEPWSRDAFFPMTQEILAESEFRDTWGDGYRVTPRVGIRITTPPMRPNPVQLDFSIPANNSNEEPIYFDAPPTIDHVAMLR